MGEQLEIPDHDDDNEHNRHENEDEQENNIFYESGYHEPKRKSVLLDINSLSMTLAAVVEENWSDEEENEDDDGYFQMKTYETDSDCDSNDSVVVKKEIVTNVTSDTLNELQKDSLSIV